MRADRLVAILLMLQSRGKVTSAEVAEELEISERTARRDLEALGMAGLPVYSQQGRGGGWQLAGGGRTDLSGLNAAEARALFLVAGPAPSATPEVKAALRKLVRALPEPLREQAEATTARVIVDPVGWDGTAPRRRQLEHLDAAQRAVVEGEQVVLGYVARNGEATTRVAHPLGLAAKGTSWYLLADTEAGLRTFRVDRITSLEGTGEPVVRPPGFDLQEAWGLIRDEVEQKRTPVRARAIADETMAGILRYVLGGRVAIGPPVAGGVEVELRGHSIESLAGEIAGFALGLDVLDPPELRAHLARLGASLVERYG